MRYSYRNAARGQGRARDRRRHRHRRGHRALLACCLFLASSQSSFVNGAVLAADGGARALDLGTLAFASP